AIRVFVDGVPMEDPYLGRFDVGSVPISDVVEIRVYAAPLSPMDGTSGAGGWIEVETLSPQGAPRLDARVRAGYPLMGRVSLTGRHPIGQNFGARLSASILGSRMPYALNQADGSRVPYNAEVGQAYAALRVDGNIGKLR